MSDYTWCPIFDELLYLLTGTSEGADFFTKRLRNRQRCAPTSNDRFYTAPHLYTVNSSAPHRQSLKDAIFLDWCVGLEGGPGHCPCACVSCKRCSDQRKTSPFCWGLPNVGMGKYERWHGKHSSNVGMGYE